MLKKFLTLLVILSMLACCACGSETASSEAVKEETPVAAAEDAEASEPAPAEEAEETVVQKETEEAAEVTEKDALAIATECIGKELSVLTDQIGEPEDSSYASSCIGDGEDGELYYEDFTVYTYKDTDGTETIEDVL